MSGYIAFILGYAAGLIPAVFFAIGFKAHRRVEDTGRFFGKVQEIEPLVNTSREVEIANETGRFDLDPYELKEQAVNRF